MTAVLAALAAAPVGADPVSKTVRNDHVTAQAFADRDALVPGATIELAVTLKMDAGWHVYWRSPGESPGLPTQVKWIAPEGFRVGRTRFPAPELYLDALGDRAYVHHGTATFLTDVEVPKNANPGQDVRLTANAEWLVCQESCVRGEANLALTLPVRSSETEAKPANADVFKKARAALPSVPEKARYLKLRGRLDVEELKPGAKAAATLAAEVDKGHHIQSNKPANEDLIATVVFLEPTDGLELGAVEYPKRKERTDPVLGKMSEYDGKVEFKIPITADEKADASPRWIRGVIRYQACTDSGTCYPPENVAFAIPVRMAGGPAPTADDRDRPASSAAADAGPGPSPTTPARPPANAFIRFQEWLLGFGFAGVIAAGILGGFLLNFMPCVLPVISLKVLSFVRQAQEDRGRIFALSLSYSAGIMCFYGLLAYLFYAFNKGWGQLFQDPVFVLIIAGVVLAFSLSLFGVFSLFAPRIVNKLGEKAEGEGHLSAFFTGVLATLLGTACTAPFLSAAVGYATRLPAAQGASIFLSAGFGMAFPFVLLGYNPAWVRFIPKPGPWLKTFEFVMGFLLLATVVWLVNPLRGQLGGYGLQLGLIFLLGVAVAVWIKGQVRFGDPLGRRLKLYASALVVLAAGWLLPFRVMATIPKLIADHVRDEDMIADGMLLDSLMKDPEIGPKLTGFLLPHIDWRNADEIPWQPYRRARALLAVRHGYTVFVDYTADWCASCKANLKTSIDRKDVIEVMRELNVVPYEADYTITRPEITEDLRKFERGGVPMYLVYKPGDTENPEILPELLTPDTVIEALRRAGPSRVKPAAGDD